MKRSLPNDSEQTQTRQFYVATGNLFRVNNMKNFADNRPEIITQRKLIDTIRSSPQMIAQRSMVELFHNSLGMVALRKQHHLMSNAIVQRKSAKQEWEMPGDIETHIFDGEEKGNNLSGLHSAARKKPGNGKLRYSEETVGYVKDSQPYGAKVKVKFGENWSPRNDAYKYSDMFPAGWNEDKVTETIEAAYDSTFLYKPNGETIRHRDNWKPGKWLGNAKGIAVVFAGHPPETIYPKR